MHDLSLIAPLCNQIEQLVKKHKAQKVIRIILEVGEGFEITPEHFQETFLFFTSGDPALRDAQFEFRKNPAIHDDHQMILRDVELEIPEAVQDV